MEKWLFDESFPVENFALKKLIKRLDYRLFCIYLMGMGSTDFTPETLSQMPKEDLVQMVIGLLNNQKEMAKNLEILTQQIAIMNQHTYGRKTESVSALQMSFGFGFNEPEAIADPAQSDPSLEEAAPARRKKKTQPKDNIAKVTNYETVNLELPKEELDRKNLIEFSA